MMEPTCSAFYYRCVCVCKTCGFHTLFSAQYTKNHRNRGGLMQPPAFVQRFRKYPAGDCEKSITRDSLPGCHATANVVSSMSFIGRPETSEYNSGKSA
jgi:hypothetical protein